MIPSSPNNTLVLVGSHLDYNTKLNSANLHLCNRHTIPRLTASGRDGAALTVGSQEGWRKEALVHQAGEGNDPDHVVGVKGQATERLTAQLLWSGRGNTNI